MSLPVRLLALILTLAAGIPLAAQQRWKLQYFYDAKDEQFVINDLAFPSPTRGIAAGVRLDGDRVRPKCVVTSDGGRTWSDVKIKAPALSLFFLDESVGWMVTKKGIWKTIESGRSWRKISKQKQINRVYFKDEQHGWAVGNEKSIWETSDGGRTWQPLPVAAEVKTTKEYTHFTWIDFSTSQAGTILGYSEPPRRRSSRLPEWMEPEKASVRRQWPTLSLVIQTRDGGRTWKASTTSMFGRIHRLRLRPDGTGLTLVRFQYAFEWPSEVYRIDLKNNTTKRSFRRKNRSITDVALAGDYAYLAGFVPSGTLAQMPIPGRLVVLRSRDLKNWQEMEVDYRANAHRAILAAAGDSHVWLATDTGMILKLTSE